MARPWWRRHPWTWSWRAYTAPRLRVVPWLAGTLAVLLMLPWPSWTTPVPADAFGHDTGHAYRVGLRGWHIASSGIAGVLEDGRPLQRHDFHDDIRARGGGRYSAWGQTLLLAPSDDEDPRTGRHRYELVRRGSALTFLEGRGLPPGVAPVVLVWLMLVALWPWLARTRSFWRRHLLARRPADNRTLLRLAAALCAWRYLSVDAGAFPVLQDGLELATFSPAAAMGVGRAFARTFLATAAGAAWTPPAIAGLWLLVAFRPRRGWVLVALLPSLLFEGAMWLYRGQLPDLEPALAVAVFAACAPWRFGAVFGDAPATRPAATWGLWVAVYFGAVYMATGLSKLVIDDWWVHADLAYLKTAMEVWHGAVPPWPWSWTAAQAEGVFAAAPALDALACASTMVVELLWVAAVFWRPARWVLPPTMFVIHLVIFASSGILFLPLATVAFASVTPVGGRRRRPPLPPGRVVRPLGLFALAAVVGLASVPGGTHHNVIPFIDYFHFNFVHDTARNVERLYRLGVIRPAGPVPLSPVHGGFIDVWIVTESARQGRVAIEGPTRRDRFLAYERLRQYRRALRPLDDRGGLLGPLGMPSHTVVDRGAATYIPGERVWLLVAERPDRGAGALDVSWQRVFEVPP